MTSRLESKEYPGFRSKSPRRGGTPLIINSVVGGNFHSLPFFDLSQTGEGPINQGDTPVDGERLVEELNQLFKDSRGSLRRSSRRRH